MKKRTKTILISVSVIVVLLLALIFLPNAPLSNLRPFVIAPSDLTSQLGTCAGGWTTFSIDKVEVTSDSGTTNKTRVYGKASGSECLSIKLTQAQLDSYLNSKGYDATKDVTGSIQLTKYVRTFPIQATTPCYRTITDNTLIDNTRTQSATLEFCKSKYPDSIYAYKPGGLIYNVRCVREGCNGNRGTFTGTSYDDFNINVNIGGQTASISRSNLATALGGTGAGEQAVGSHYIEWTGNLNALDNIGTPYQYEGMLYQSKYDLVKLSDYVTTDSAYSGFINCLSSKKIIFSGSNQMSDADFDTCKNKFTTLVTGLYSPQNTIYEESVKGIAYDITTDKNALYMSLKASPFPTFILDLDAESVGIIAISGTPKITSCISNQDLNSGTNKPVSFGISNIATGGSVQFTGDVSCNGGVTSFVSPFQISGGQSQTINTILIPSNPNQQVSSGSCTLTIKDTKSGKSDYCSFSTKVNYVSGITCSAGTISCDTDGNLYQCNSEGNNKAKLKDCASGCEYKSGVATCKGEAPPEPNKCGSCDAFVVSNILGSVFKSKKCQSATILGIPTQTNLTCTFYWVKYIVTFIGLIFVILFGGLFFQEIKGLRKVKWVAWIISVVLGILLSMLIFYTFWIGVIVGIVYLIFNIVVGGYLKKFRGGLR